jgi:response regulator RpfG family c-di-GMP phosphodiesterase
MADKILLVDDEQNVLQGLRRQLRGQFDIDIANSGIEALKCCQAQGPYAVVVSDMQMPGMNGVQFLQRLREISPDSIRVMLTGNADQHTAAAAVNEGEIFRFINKPCPADTLARTLQAGIAQHQLVMAEKTLIQKTLTGSIKVLTDILALANPTAFGRNARVRPLVRALATQLKFQPLWEMELAAMLCHVGCVAMPEETLQKAFTGQPLPPADQGAFDDHPRVGRELIGNISRLEEVARIVGYQQKQFEGGGFPADDLRGEDIPLGGRILKVALDYDRCRASGLGHAQSLAEMNSRNGHYDPQVFTALQTLESDDPKYTLANLRLVELREGMLLADHVAAENGAILIVKGQAVTDSLRVRLLSFAKLRGVREPIAVLVPDPPSLKSPVVALASAHATAPAALTPTFVP